ncbi:MAG TPA: PEP-CTERM sorting domain-containing protein [Fimbriimonadaceae bacterium]|nr:PEP-CTERM sorting domain-containing protein [Fimbriimonadaceae bacterium]
MSKYIREAAVLAVAGISAVSFGQNVVLELADGGCTAQVNAGTSASSGPLGVNSWTVGGTQEIRQQVYLLSINGGGVVPINDLGAPAVDQPSSREVTIRYTQSDYTISVHYLLTGGAPDLCDLSEQVTLMNTSNGSFTYNLEDLNHLAPANQTGGTATLLDPNTIQQVNNGTAVTVGTDLTPTHWMINTFSSAASSALGGGNLPDGSSPFTNSDIGSVFQWRGSLGAGDSLQFNVNKEVAVPEPASLLALGGLTILALRRRR